MKTNRILIALAVAAIVAPSFQSCKKGENDPFLSLRSRKARVAGEWDVTKHSVVKEVEANNWGVTSKYNVAENFENNKFTVVTTYKDPNNTSVETETYTASRDISFTKEGTFTKNYSLTDVEKDTVFMITTSGVKYYIRTTTITTKDVITGTWNFLNGVGDVKNKEVLHLSNVKTATTEDVVVDFAAYSGTPSDADEVSSTNGYKETVKSEYTSNKNFEQWYLDQLKNSEMIGKIEINEVSSSDTITDYKATGSATITLTAK